MPIIDFSRASKDVIDWLVGARVSDVSIAQNNEQSSENIHISLLITHTGQLGQNFIYTFGLISDCIIKPCFLYIKSS